MRHVSVLVTVAKKILLGLATDALGSLGGFAMVKMLKRGREQTGGYMIPIDKIVQLVRYQNMLTTYNKLAEAIRLGSPFIVKETKKQSVGFLGTLLSSLGAPLSLKASTGNDIQSYSRYQPPPLPPQPKVTSQG